MITVLDRPELNRLRGAAAVARGMGVGDVVRAAVLRYLSDS